MEYFKFFLIPFALMFICVADATEKFEYKDCSKGKGIATISKLSVSPHPISLSKNITATVDVTFHEDIPKGAVVKVNLYKVTSVFGVPINIPIPCLFGFGSCTTEHCEYIGGARDLVCPFFPKDRECKSCPWKAGKYSADNVAMPTPELGPLAKHLAQGHFKYEMRIMTKDKKKELICIWFTGKLAP